MDLKKIFRAFFFSRNDKYYSRKYYSRENYYEKLFDKYSDATSYFSLINTIQNKQNIVSKRLITFNNKKYVNITKQDIFQQYGRPNYQIVTNKKLKTELIFYRLYIGGHKVKLELHIHNNHLFLFTYIFSYLKANEKYQIIKLIEKKYLDQQQLDYSNVVIIDNRQSVINITDSINFTINYICCINSDFFQKIEKIKDNQTLSLEKDKKRVAVELYRKL